MELRRTPSLDAGSLAEAMTSVQAKMWRGGKKVSQRDEMANIPNLEKSRNAAKPLSKRVRGSASTDFVDGPQEVELVWIEQ